MSVSRKINEWHSTRNPELCVNQEFFIRNRNVIGPVHVVFAQVRKYAVFDKRPSVREASIFDYVHPGMYIGAIAGIHCK